MKSDKNSQFEIRNSRFGFTMIELLVVIFIMTLLTSLVTTNFQRQRQQQEIQASSSDLISKIREIQSNLLGGKVVPAAGKAAEAYQIVFTPGSTAFRVDYNAGGATTTLETVSLPTPNVVIDQIVPGSANPIYLRAPFGKITAGGVANLTIQIDLKHSKSGNVRSVIIDGVSGKIGLQ